MKGSYGHTFWLSYSHNLQYRMAIIWPVIKVSDLKIPNPKIDWFYFILAIEMDWYILFRHWSTWIPVVYFLIISINHFDRASAPVVDEFVSLGCLSGFAVVAEQPALPCVHLLSSGSCPAPLFSRRDFCQNLCFYVSAEESGDCLLYTSPSPRD